MTDKEMLTKEIKGIGRFIGHSAVVFLGLMLLIAALAMGVTLVLLPGAVIAGAAGLLLITWGMYAPASPQSVSPAKTRRMD
jgi:hypothetical protein